MRGRAPHLHAFAALLWRLKLNANLAGLPGPGIALAAALALALLLAHAVVPARAVGPQRPGGRHRIKPLGSRPPRPLIYVYDSLPQELTNFGGWYESRVRMSKKLIEDIKRTYGTRNGDEADYFLIPSTGHYASQEALLQLFGHVRQDYPWWNRTREAGQARHLILMLGDLGPASAAFDHPIDLDDPRVPPDVHPLSPSRTVAFLTWNGLRDLGTEAWRKCQTCFTIGKDIMIPTGENVCGPLCGYDLAALQAQSVWRLGERQLQRELTRKRRYRLFFAGTVTHPAPDDFTGRGGVWHHYANRSDYLVVRNGAPGVEKVDFAQAMRDSDFCFSPMGQSGGDPDRYVAAVLFGCVPVMLNSSFHTAAVPHALPLEEVLPWERFSTVIHAWDLASLDAQLQCLEPHLPALRRAMRGVWQRLLYSNAYDRTYLGEDRTRDAMHTLMQVLASRVPHGFKPSRATMQRMAHHPHHWPCTGRPPQLAPSHLPQ